MRLENDMLHAVRAAVKLYEQYEREVGERHGLQLIETDILAFLRNNPGCDTASDIAELRMLQKGNVSPAVDRLCRKGLLRRTPDAEDRRKIHLSLTEPAEEIVHEIQEARASYLEALFTGFSARERSDFQKTAERILNNALTAPKKEKAH